ncbi:GntR family transcriptional regulator [Sulfobacillus harzensis]|uniref:GntR family transcriptional regulator n=1 Tax=Sulfobacillus harzensis TaxID=2729629 RepID=A0A7Y0L0P1_9FIRM|nr:GntR family transcriptional regulator [Sulfobacillus harzensis]NMP21128.1 GntR family transcriptional regulator [Sulfobacillus harzensis]
MSKTEQVYQILQHRIMGGHYSPGFRLVIDSLARDLGVSTMPVREAIRRLEAEGLVRYQPNVGAEVAGLDGRHFHDMQEVLAKLEGWIWEICGPLAATEEIGRLSTLANGMQTALDGRRLEDFVVLEGQFHDIFHQRSPNRYLAELANRGWTRLEPLRLALYVQAPDMAIQALHYYYQLVQSLKEKAPPKVLGQLVEESHQQLLVVLRRQVGDRKEAQP